MSGEGRSAAVLAIVTAALLLAGWLTYSWMEARAYNRVTGGSVTTWDALWLDLRVVGTERP